ncbi:MAG: orotate phosphoribosyltransferase [Elusimicrobia bacterium]|nr:orotate phosphoribosyltransferase [Elusimicrobiota bacterium]
MKEKNFIDTGAIKEGHFLLSSGLHSDHYFQAQSLLKYPKEASKAGKAIARLWKKDGINVVVSLAIGGIVIGQEVARHLGTRHIFLERKKGAMKLERGFSLDGGERVLMIEDVITTGGSLLEGIEVLKNYGVMIAGIGALVLRGKPELPYPVRTLLVIDWPTYTKEDCPLCRSGVPIYAPGSKQGN